MAQRSRRLWDAVQLTASVVTYYTATSVRAKNLWITATNPNAVAYLVTIYLIKTGGSASDSMNVVTYQRTILPGQTVIFYECCGHVLENGDFIQAKCDTASKIVFMGSGDEVSIGS